MRSSSLRRLATGALVALAAFAIAPSAAAQLTTLGTPTLADSPVFASSGWVPDRGGLSFRGFFARLSEEESSDTATASLDQNLFILRGTAGLGGRLALGATVPYRSFEAELDGTKDEVSGLGDASLFLDWQLVRASEGRTALTAVGEVTFATGEEDIGEGETTWIGLGAVVSHRTGRVSFHASTGVDIPTDDDFKNVVPYSAAVVVQASDAFSLSGELVGSKLMDEEADAENMLGLGARLTLGRVLLDGGALFGVGDAAPDNGFAMALTIVR